MHRLTVTLFICIASASLAMAQTVSATGVNATLKKRNEFIDSLRQSLPGTPGFLPAENPPQEAGTDVFQLTNNVFIVLVIFMILVFSFAIIRSLLNPRNTDPLDSNELIRVVSMILIVTCALLVPVVAGQISSIPTVSAPLYSLLGTVAGYLLGKSSLNGSGPGASSSGPNPPSTPS